MLVKDDRGFKVWGSVPGNLQLFDSQEIEQLTDDDDLDHLRHIGWTIIRDLVNGLHIVKEIQRSIKKGDRVAFNATLSRSDDDSKFGFYKRPTKSQLLTN